MLKKSTGRFKSQEKIKANNLVNTLKTMKFKF